MYEENPSNSEDSNTPPLETQSDEEPAFYFETPVSLIKSKTSPNPYLDNFNEYASTTTSLNLKSSTHFPLNSQLNTHPVSEYDLKTIGPGLALVLLFETAESDLIQARLMSSKIEKILNFFNFATKIIDTMELKEGRVDPSKKVPSSASSRTKSFSTLFGDALNSIEAAPYSCVVLFVIGQSVPDKESRGILSFKIPEGLDTKTVISHKYITQKIVNTLSHSKHIKPGLLFFNYVSQQNSPLTPERNICPNTFFSYTSLLMNSLPHGVKPHQFIVSFYEALRDAPPQSQLSNIFLQAREKYFDNLGTDSVFFVKDTLREPFYFRRVAPIQDTAINISQDAPGLFMLLTNENFMQRRWSFIPELIESIKKEFELMNFTITQDILLVGKSSYTQTLAKNKSLCQNCRCVFVLILTSDGEPHKVSLKDKTFLKINIFSHELANSFPDIPRAIFLSQVVNQEKNLDVSASQSISSPIDVDTYQNLFLVHSVEKNLSGANNFLLANLSLAMQRNYFAELHSICYNAISQSNKTSFIQIVDGLRKNFFFNSQDLSSPIFNKESEKYKKAYNLACIQGSEPFRFYRLMVVGPEGVGKTSLLRSLTGLPFKFDQESTPFLNKFDLQVHKISHGWDQIEDLDTYANNLEDTRQDMAVKYARGLLDSTVTDTAEGNLLYGEIASEDIKIEVNSSSETTDPSQRTYVSSQSFGEETKQEYDDTASMPNFDKSKVQEIVDIPSSDVDFIEYPPRPDLTAAELEYSNFFPEQKIRANLIGSDEFSSKSDFLTAWDFAGQNYLYCFHSLFLSPRAIYLLLIDLSVEDLTADINVRKERMDRIDLRSQVGVPNTYLEAIEFWLDAIFSVSKTASTDIYQRPAKVIFVFNKSDLVENPRLRAEAHLDTVRSHMNKRNNSFSLVHEDDGIFLISCIPDSPFSSNIADLKNTIKHQSDQIAFHQPIPIKWLEFAKVILRDEQPILGSKRIHYLAESCQCSEDLEHFLHLFHDIGFFFFKQGKIIKDVQKFLDLIYNIVSPQYGTELVEYIPNKDIELLKRDLKMCHERAELSSTLFDAILKSLNLSILRESILSLLLIYGILISNQAVHRVSNYFYVPYLLTGSFKYISELLPPHYAISSFYLYFPDGFIPASLYFTLLSKCIHRNEEKGQPLPKLGFDCAYFYICSSVLVSIDSCKRKPYIRVIFSKIGDVTKGNSIVDGYVRSEIMSYLVFLQMLIVDIQAKLIPCGNLAKVVLDCICGRLPNMEQVEQPCICLDQLLLTNARARESWCYNQQCKVDWNHYFNDNDFLLDYMTKFYDNTSLAKFIIDHQDTFITHINCIDLSSLLYRFGLVTSERIFDNMRYTQCENAASLLEELVHKGSLWAIKFYVVLCREYTNPGHQFLRSLLDKNISTGLIKPLSHNISQPIDSMLYHDRYRMNSNPHGIAFLLNIESFASDQSPIRKGSRWDLISLRQTFEQLQYVVVTRENLARSELKKELFRLAHLDHSSYDSLFCVIMSHGDENDNIILSDGKKISIEEITCEFSHTYCSSLAGKPKIFIIQACRGSKIEVLQKNDEQKDNSYYRQIAKKNTNMNPTVFASDKRQSETFDLESGKLHPVIQPLRQRLVSFGSIEEEPEILSEVSDIFIANSTVHRYASFRNTAKGSIFIQSFCLVLRYCRYEEFMHIMTEVRRRVSLYQTHTQCTEDISHLRKKLYF